MKTTTALIAAAAIACALALMAVGAATAQRPAVTTIRATATMTPDQEVPRPTGNVSDARGSFAARISKARFGGTMAFTMVFNGLTGPATAAHIHIARPGRAGPVAVPLCSPCTSPQTNTGNIRLSQQALAAIQAGTAYVNVHTAANPDGEIRGQVGVTARLFVKMSKGRVVPRAKGYRRATGLLRGAITRVGNRAELEWTLRFSRLTGKVTGAHIHRGGPGENGRAVVRLCGACKDAVRGTVRLRPALVQAFEDGLLYVDIHTRRNPKGEVRGNIFSVPLSLSP